MTVGPAILTTAGMRLQEEWTLQLESKVVLRKDPFFLGGPQGPQGPDGLDKAHAHDGGSSASHKVC